MVLEPPFWELLDGFGLWPGRGKGLWECISHLFDTLFRSTSLQEMKAIISNSALTDWRLACMWPNFSPWLQQATDVARQLSQSQAMPQLFMTRSPMALFHWHKNRTITQTNVFPLQHFFKKINDPRAIPTLPWPFSESFYFISLWQLQSCTRILQTS